MGEITIEQPKAKPVESFRQKHAGTHIVRILHTKPMLDDKWRQLCGIQESAMKKFLVVRYPADCEKYIPVWNTEQEPGKKVIWWEETTHSAIKTAITAYDDEWDRHVKNQNKSKQARIMFADADADFILTDDFQFAQDKYLEWLDDLGIIGQKYGAGTKGHGIDDK